MNFQDLPLALTYDDVLLVPQYSEIFSRSDVSLETRISPSITLTLPIISINMDTVTGLDMARAMYNAGGISFYPRFKAPEEQVKDISTLLSEGVNVIPAIGIKETEQERADLLVKAGVKAITIDVAHGHLRKSLDTVKLLRSKYPKLDIIAGVIATYEGAKDLFDAGADSVRVGVGPGTICTTRSTTGCGVPQITATSEAYRAAKEFGKVVITDGGTKTTGDIVKALAAGAGAVVTGSQLAGTEEAPGDIIEINGKKYKEYNGSTSRKEKIRQMTAYSKDKNTSYIKHVEGQEALVPYKGSVGELLELMSANIRSGMSYCNSRNIEELHDKAVFIRVTPISASENGAHGVVVR